VDTFSREIRVGNQLPTASFTRTPQVGVNPLVVNVNGSASSDVDGTIVSYAWNFGNGQTATGATASTTYTDPGTYTITLTVTDNRGGTGTTTQTFTVGQNQPPVAVLNLNTLGAAPFNLVANGGSSFDVDGTIVSYQFTLTGTTQGGAPVFSSVPAGPASQQTFSLPQPGNYSITLVVTDDKGVTGSVTESVLVGQAPTASFTATPTSGQNPLVVNVNGGASSDPDGTIVNYAWNFGNGQTATGVTASTTYTDPGTYIVTLTVTDNVGLTASTTRTITVAQNQAPVANIAATPTAGVNPLVVNVSGAGSTDDGTIVSYAWDFGNGQTATGVTASTTYTDPGSYEITLTVTDDKGVTGTATRTIEVGQNQAPIASFTATPTSGDTPLVVALDASASSDVDGTIASYAWNFGNGQTATGVTATATYPVAGTYTVTLTVTDDKGVTASATQTISVSVPVGARDAVNLRFGGAVDYEYVGPTIGNSLRIVRDAFGPLRVRGTETYPSLVSGQGEVRATLDRFLIFNAFTGNVRVRDPQAGLNLTTDINFLSGLSQPTATSVRGQGGGFVGTFQSYSLTFVIDDRT
jgi:PKD repeat protein